MNNKIALIYENDEYRVEINGSIVDKDRDIDNSFFKFKQVINNNLTSESKAFEGIAESLKEFVDKGLEINFEYKTINFGVMKYFYNMGKVFYMANGSMIPLRGGYNLFKFALTIASNGNREKSEGFIKFCKEIVENNTTYRITESSIIVSSASFNYGAAEYNFISGKINKGASIVEGNFEEFKSYVLEIIG
ncbi:hypothetical protein JCM1393_23070 [Clostridium carnis]